MLYKNSAQASARKIDRIILRSFFSFLFAFLFLIFTSNSLAQVPPPYVPCEDTDSPEFHSLRPYQASPCGEPPGKEPTEELALFCGNDLVVKDSITRSKSDAYKCEDIGNNQERCYFSTENTTTIAIDLSDADLPIAGYTEDEELEDGDKVNDYVSWYLQGTAKNAQGEPADPDTEEGRRKIIDFSGPIQKLLSWTSLNEGRSETVERAGKDRHDQIVGCTTGGGQIVSCNSGSASREVRLSSWSDNLPPSPSDYRRFRDFWLAYKGWLGDFCLSLFDISICIDNPFTFRYPGTLFSYIPLSTTEDRKGLVETETTPTVTGSGVTITDLTFTNQEPAEIFVAHMKEIAELAKILQRTFLPQGAEDVGGTSQVAPTTSCDLTQIRTNPGDDLFAGEIKGDLNYTAEFTCDFDKPEFLGPCLTSASCASGLNCYLGQCVDNGFEPNPSCTKDIFVNLSVITKTPVADEVWERFVSGPASIVKRIFPQVGSSGPLAAFLDIPAATKVNYSGEGLIYAGNTGSDRKGEDAELYFPHLGSVSEYFLKGIQTLLRPKGYGEQLISGQPGTVPKDPDVDTDVNCNQNAPEANVPGIISKEAFVSLAQRLITEGETNAEACYNDVIAKARSRGINPAYALVVWLLESNASNYGASVEDFGIHLADVRGFNDQIERFFGTVTSGLYTSCAGNSFWKDKMEATLYMYRTGNCVKSGNTDGAFYYTAVKDFFWPAVAPGCAFPTSPTQNTCN